MYQGYILIKKKNRRPIDEIAPKKQNKKQQPKYRAHGDGRLLRRRGQLTKSIAKKSTTGSLPPAVPLAITPTFSPWTHTSDDSYIYQLSLVLATAIVSFKRKIS